MKSVVYFLHSFAPGFFPRVLWKEHLLKQMHVSALFLHTLLRFEAGPFRFGSDYTMMMSVSCLVLIHMWSFASAAHLLLTVLFTVEDIMGSGYSYTTAAQCIPLSLFFFFYQGVKK